MPLCRLSCGLAILASSLVACRPSPEAPAATTPAPAATQLPPMPAAAIAPVQIEMKNVRLHVAAGVVLNVRNLRGEMVSRAADSPPVFDDQRSFVIHMFAADVTMDMASLTNLMNDYAFAWEDAPVKDIEISVDEGRLKQKGKMHKGVWLPFSMKASVSATPDGRMRLHTESVKALGLPVTKLLDLFDLTLDKLLTIEKGHGMEVKDDDMIISPSRILPPPELQGRLAKVEIVGQQLHQVFSSADSKSAAVLTPPDPKARNYVYFYGSSIRFGKLTMTGSDLQLIDADERDPFDFYPAKYEAQLIAGYSKNTPSRALKTFMPDYNDLGRVKDLTPPARRSSDRPKRPGARALRQR
jgi:hypothetical protein